MANPLATLKSIKMKDMHVEPKSKKDYQIEAEPYDKPSIPYGLKINLDKDSLKNLGMTVSDFSVKGKVMIYAEAEVCEIRSSSSEYSESENVEMKITNMAVAPKKSKGK